MTTNTKFKTRQQKWLKTHPFYNKLWKLANKERINKLRREKRKRRFMHYKELYTSTVARNKDIIAQFKYTPCTDCHKRYDPFIMHFDHREPKYKKRTISRMATSSLRYLLSEISKCDVVCANCHGIRTLAGMRNGTIPVFGRYNAQ